MTDIGMEVRMLTVNHYVIGTLAGLTIWMLPTEFESVRITFLRFYIGCNLTFPVGIEQSL